MSRQLSYLAHPPGGIGVTQKGGKVEMHLFGGTVGDEGYLERGRNEVMRRFTDLGIECTEVVPPEPQSTLTLLIADIQRETIRYQYKPHRKINR
ncbi:MAG: hypothetical protein NUV73_00950 [Candidatus Daviesbacteria bacterium]|nr:hypothetical protein [Candidatus Daviesbacteria bacterium]